MAVTTLGEAKDKIFRAVHEEDGAYLDETDVKDWISDCQIQMLGDKFYPFLEDSIIFNSSGDTNVIVNIESTDVTIDVTSTDDLSSTGVVYVDGMVVTYTGVGTNPTSDNPYLTGCTGISADITSGADVRQIYSLATLGVSNYEKPIYVSVDGAEKVYYDGRGEIQSDGYTVVDDYLYLPFSSSVEPVIFKYKQYVDVISEDTDTFTIPERYRNILTEYATWKAKELLQYDDARGHAIEFHRLNKKFNAHYGHQTAKTNNFISSAYR